MRTRNLVCAMYEFKNRYDLQTTWDVHLTIYLQEYYSLISHIYILSKVEYFIKTTIIYLPKFVIYNEFVQLWHKALCFPQINISSSNISPKLNIVYHVLVFRICLYLTYYINEHSILLMTLNSVDCRFHWHCCSLYEKHFANSPVLKVLRNNDYCLE